MAVTSAAAQLGLGEGLRAEVLLVAGAYAVAAALTLFIATQVSQSLLIGFLVSLAPVLIFPVSYAYPKLLLYALWFVAAFHYGAKPTWPGTIGLAAVIAVAFLFRHDHGVVLALASVPVVAVRQGATAAGFVAFARIGADASSGESCTSCGCRCTRGSASTSGKGRSLRVAKRSAATHGGSRPQSSSTGASPCGHGSRAVR